MTEIYWELWRGKLKHRRSTRLLEAGNLKEKESYNFSAGDVDVGVVLKTLVEDDESREGEPFIRIGTPWRLSI